VRERDMWHAAEEPCMGSAISGGGVRGSEQNKGHKRINSNPQASDTFSHT